MNPPPVSFRLRAGLFLAYFIVICLLLGNTLHDAYIDDAIGYMGSSTEDFSRHLGKPFVDMGDTGHPQLICYLVAPFWKLHWAWRLEFSHLAIWLCGALALTASHVLAVRLAGGRYPRGPHAVGVAVAVILLAHPLMISHVAQYLNDVPMMAFGMCLVLTVVERRYGWATLWACALAFTKITGTIGVTAVGTFEFAAWVYRRGWRAGWKAGMVRFLPYAVSGILFGIYLFVKLVLLHRPLSVFAEHNAWITTGPELLQAAHGVFRVFLETPPYAMKGWLYLGLAGGWGLALRYAYQAFKREKGTPVATSEQMKAYGLMLWMTLLYGAFYTVQALWDQARWFLMFYPLLAIAGLHCLLLISRGRIGAWGPPVLVWAGFQMLRWHAAWLAPLEPVLPGVTERLQVIPSSFSLDYRSQIDLYHQAFRALEREQPIDVVYCLYPTSGALVLPCTGYTKKEISSRCVFWFADDQALAAQVREDLKSPGEIVTLMASWDSLLPENRERIAHLFKTETLFRATSPLGEWIEIARVLPPGDN